MRTLEVGAEHEVVFRVVAERLKARSPDSISC